MGNLEIFGSIIKIDQNVKFECEIGVGLMLNITPIVELIQKDPTVRMSIQNSVLVCQCVFQCKSIKNTLGKFIHCEVNTFEVSFLIK